GAAVVGDVQPDRIGEQERVPEVDSDQTDEVSSLALNSAEGQGDAIRLRHRPLPRLPRAARTGCSAVAVSVPSDVRLMPVPACGRSARRNVPSATLLPPGISSP